MTNGSGRTRKKPDEWRERASERGEGKGKRYAHTPVRSLAAFKSSLTAFSNRSYALVGKGLNQGCSDLTWVLISNGFMKTNKVPRERNPFLLSGKRRWRLFRWIFRRSKRDDATNNVLSQGAKPA
jgi:hypothetical protein